MDAACPVERFADDDTTGEDDDDVAGRARSNGLGTSSAEGETAVSLKRSRATATLRPMPAVEEGGAAKTWLAEEDSNEEPEDDDEVEEVEDLRLGALADLEVVSGGSGGDAREDDEGRVYALPGKPLMGRLRIGP